MELNEGWSLPCLREGGVPQSRDRVWGEDNSMRLGHFAHGVSKGKHPAASEAGWTGAVVRL